MTTPNFKSLTLINGDITYYTPSATTDVVLLPNANNSNHIFKINFISIANIDGSNSYNATVSLYTNGAVSQGGAPSGGSAYAIASTISVPANSTLVLIDKNSSFYLKENMSVIVKTNVASKLTYTISYEDLS